MLTVGGLLELEIGGGKHVRWNRDSFQCSLMMYE